MRAALISFGARGEEKLPSSVRMDPGTAQLRSRHGDSDSRAWQILQPGISQSQTPHPQNTQSHGRRKAEVVRVEMTHSQIGGPWSLSLALGSTRNRQVDSAFSKVAAAC